MKQIKFPIFSFILFLCFFTKSFEVTHISRNLCQKSMKIIVNWPTSRLFLVSIIYNENHIRIE